METELNEVRLFECKTWGEFVDAVRKPRWRREESSKRFQWGIDTIFRGHSSQNYRLSSTIERRFAFSHGFAEGTGEPIQRSYKSLTDEFERHCQRILESFREHALGLDGIGDETGERELWTIGRHYGLDSPYLDWSRSPFVAAFFAFSDAARALGQIEPYEHPAQIAKEPVCVWGLRLWDDIVDKEFEAFQVRGRRFTRARAQQAWFTRLKTPDYLDLECYFESTGIAHYLEKYVISPDVAKVALSQLDLMNINYLNLFPDPVGAALHANIDMKSLRDAIETEEVPWDDSDD